MKRKGFVPSRARLLFLRTFMAQNDLFKGIISFLDANVRSNGSVSSVQTFLPTESPGAPVKTAQHLA